MHGATIKRGDHFARMTKSCMMEPNICGSPVWNLLNVALLVIGMFRQHLDFFLNFFTPVTSLSFKCVHHFVTVLWLLQYNELPFLCKFNQFLQPPIIAVGSQIFSLLLCDVFNIDYPSREYTHIISGQMTMKSNGIQVGCVSYTGCPRRNVQYFGRVFLMLNYTDITQNTYIQS